MEEEAEEEAEALLVCVGWKSIMVIYDRGPRWPEGVSDGQPVRLQRTLRFQSQGMGVSRTHLML